MASSNRLVIDEDSQDLFDEDFSRYGFNNGESPKKQKGLDSEFFVWVTLSFSGWTEKISTSFILEGWTS